MPAELFDRHCDVGELRARAAMLNRNEYREHALHTQRGERLVEDQPVAVDFVGRGPRLRSDPRGDVFRLDGRGGATSAPKPGAPDAWGSSLVGAESDTRLGEE